MTTEVRPLGTLCNVKCGYCYQESIREAGNFPHGYDIDKIIEEIDRVGSNFTLFGGEPLLVPKNDLETFWKHGLEKYGRNGIQTNGTLVDDDHIEMFKKYKVAVGFSIDGPNELNGLRRLRKESTDEENLKVTEKIIHNIMKTREAGIDVGIIITLHKLNGTKDRLPRLLKFIRWLGNNGIRNGNIHTLEVDPTLKDQEKYVLSQKENVEAFLTLADFFEENVDLQWSPFTDFRKVLNGNDNEALCYWNNCDPMDTQAVYGIDGDGTITNCGRTNKDGIDWYKANTRSYGRYISLYYTPDEMGGCKGCRFWSTCGGSCPGEAAEYDMRNKTIHCQTQKSLLTYYEEKLEENGIVPVSKSPLLPMVEKIMLDAFYSGHKVTVNHVMKTLNDIGREVIIVPVVKEEEYETTRN